MRLAWVHAAGAYTRGWHGYMRLARTFGWLQQHVPAGAVHAAGGMGTCGWRGWHMYSAALSQRRHTSAMHLEGYCSVEHTAFAGGQILARSWLHSSDSQVVGSAEPPRGPPELSLPVTARAGRRPWLNGPRTNLVEKPFICPRRTALERPSNDPHMRYCLTDKRGYSSNGPRTTVKRPSYDPRSRSRCSRGRNLGGGEPV